MILVDTGPLVAAANAADRRHAECVAALNQIRGPRLVPGPVIAETCYLLAREAGAARVEAAFLRSFAAGASTTGAVFKAADVVAAFHQAVGAHGLPRSVLTDNAAVFSGQFRGGGWVALHRELTALGIRLHHSRPYHPQTCGKVERFHQTLKKWLAKQDPARTLAELQTQLDEFTRIYNTERPHRALDRTTPAAAYAARPLAAPDGPRLDTSEDTRIRRDKIDSCGKVTLRHNSRLRHISIGRRHAGTRVLLLVHGLHVRVISEDGELLRDLTLDPTRDYQSRARE